MSLLHTVFAKFSTFNNITVLYSYSFPNFLFFPTNPTSSA